MGRRIGLRAELNALPMEERVPGCYFFIGHTGPFPHHPECRFDPEIIPVGAAIVAELMRACGGFEANTQKRR